jgi:hypothetical protein
MKILVVDDDRLYPVSGLRDALCQVGRNRHHILQARSPDGVEQVLDQHPDIDLVFVDMHFHQAGTQLTGLTALRTLAWRTHPVAAIYCQPEPNRQLFPYAACQLFERPPVAWIQKTAEAIFDQAIPLIDQIETRRIPQRSPTLSPCYTNNPYTGNLIRQLLGSPGDLKIWREVSRARLTYKDVATLTHYSPSTVRQRFANYVNAIIAFTAASKDPDMPQPKDPAPTVWKFADQNREFFRAPELDGLLKEKFGVDNR